MTLRVDKHIFGFEIAIDDALRMQMLKGKHHLGGIKLGTSLRETNLVTQVEEKLTTIEEISDEVEGLCRLESVMQFDHKGMRYLLHNVPFNFCVLDLVIPDNEIFFESLHRVNLSIILFLRHIYFPEGASSDHL